MTESRYNLILDEFCQYEPTNKDDDISVFNYKMLESHIYYERVNKPCQKQKSGTSSRLVPDSNTQDTTSSFSERLKQHEAR